MLAKRALPDTDDPASAEPQSKQPRLQEESTKAPLPPPPQGWSPNCEVEPGRPHSPQSPSIPMVKGIYTHPHRGSDLASHPLHDFVLPSSSSAEQETRSEPPPDSCSDEWVQLKLPCRKKAQAEPVAASPRGDNPFNKLVTEKWHLLCAAIFASYALFVCLVSILPIDSDHEGEEIPFDHGTFRKASAMTCVCFISAAVQTLTRLLTSEERGPIMCMVTVNVVSAITHMMMATGIYPHSAPVRIVPGAQMVTQVFRWCEWVALVPILMVLAHSLDPVCDHDLAVKSVVLQTLSTALGGVACLLPCSWRLTAIGLFVLSYVAYCHIFVVVARVHHEHQKFRAEMSQTGGTADAVDGVNVEASVRAVVQKEQLANSMTQSQNLLFACTVTWTLFVVVFSFGMFGVLSPTRTSVFLNIVDVIAKIAYVTALGNAHSAIYSPHFVLSRALAWEKQTVIRTREFLRYLCHEIRSPLNTVTLSVDELVRTIRVPGASQTLEIIRCAMAIVGATLDDVLSLQRVESGHSTQIHKKPFDFPELVQNRIACYEPLAAEQHMNIVKTGSFEENSQVALIGDSVRLSSVVGNFIHNAIKFSRPDAKKIIVDLRTLSSTKTHRTVRLSVVDQGVGMSASDLDTLFSPFKQIRPGDLQAGRGSGLGLCIAREIVESHGGDTGVISSAGKGTTMYFTITFAVADKLPHSPLEPGVTKELTPVSQESAKGGSVESAEVPNGKTEKKRKVLVVDDIKSARILLGRALQNLGYEVDLASDGVDALEMLFPSDGRDTPYDLMVLDSVMPRMDGPEMIRQARARGCSIPVIGCTANALEEDAANFKKSGVTVVISKPIKMSVLRDAIQNLLHHPAPVAAAASVPSE